MTIQAHPAHVSSIPVILRTVPVLPQEEDQPEATTPLAKWCRSIGRTTADVAALLFTMPTTDVVRQIFEDEIRQTIAAELLTRQMDDAERQHLEDLAWMAFDRRMERHGWNDPRGGTA